MGRFCLGNAAPLPPGNCHLSRVRPPGLISPIPPRWLFGEETLGFPAADGVRAQSSARSKVRVGVMVNVSPLKMIYWCSESAEGEWAFANGSRIRGLEPGGSGRWSVRGREQAEEPVSTWEHAEKLLASTTRKSLSIFSHTMEVLSLGL